MTSESSFYLQLDTGIYYLGLPQITDFVKVCIRQGNNRFPTMESLHICSLISFHQHMASACFIFKYRYYVARPRSLLVRNAAASYDP